MYSFEFLSIFNHFLMLVLCCDLELNPKLNSKPLKTELKMPITKIKPESKCFDCRNENWNQYSFHSPSLNSSPDGKLVSKRNFLKFRTHLFLFFRVTLILTIFFALVVSIRFWKIFSVNKPLKKFYFDFRAMAILGTTKLWTRIHASIFWTSICPTRRK